MSTTINRQLRKMPFPSNGILRSAHTFPGGATALPRELKSGAPAGHCRKADSGSLSRSAPARDPRPSPGLGRRRSVPRSPPAASAARASPHRRPQRRRGGRGWPDASALTAGTGARERSRQVPQRARLRPAPPARPRPPGAALTQKVRLKMNSRILMQRIRPRTVPMAGAGSGSSSPGGSAELGGGSARGGERGGAGAGRQVRGWAGCGEGRAGGHARSAAALPERYRGSGPAPGGAWGVRGSGPRWRRSPGLRARSGARV